MTNLSGGECHNHTKKRVGCDPHVETSKAAILKKLPFSHTRANRKEYHDAIEEDATSSNTSYNVSIEEETRNKQDGTMKRHECQ